MSDRAAAGAPKPIWVKQAEEARLKSEAEKTAAAKAAFEATFKALEAGGAANPADKKPSPNAYSAAKYDSDDDDDGDLSGKPAGPVDPSKCLAAGAGIAGGTAGAPSTFTVVTKDADGRKVSVGGAQVRVKISPGVNVGGSDQEGIVKDQNDGTYAVTYAVPQKGNYMVHVECNGRPVMGSPFPVFFSTGQATVMGTTGMTPTVSSYTSMINQTMPNMPNYSGSVSGAFPGLLGMIPSMLPGASGGVVLPGMAGATLGEICREYLNGRCAKADCKFSHPPNNMLLTALAGSTTMGTLSQQPMAPSAAAMAAAQAIVAARQAAQMQAQAQSASGGSSGSSDKVAKADALKKTLQVSNLSPLLTADHLKQLFAYCGTVVDCTITDSKHFAYIEYSKPEEAAAALHLNNIDIGGRPLNVEMAKTLPSRTAATNSSLPLALQQAVALQQMQFQQALLMQQTMASQQAASRAATMKSATEMAAARAAEISKKLKADGLVGDDNDTSKAEQKSRSPSPPRHKSRSRSPIKYRRSRRSRSISPSIRYPRDRRSRSPIRSSHYSYATERRSYRDDRDTYCRIGRRERDRSRDRFYSSSSRRNKSRSPSPRPKKLTHAGSVSPKNRGDSLSPRSKRSSRAGSRSPRRHKDSSKSSPVRDHKTAASRRSRHSRSRSAERNYHASNKDDLRDSDKSKHEFRKSDKRISDKDAKDSKEPTDDSTFVVAAVSQKRSSLTEDGSSKHERDSSHHKKSKRDHPSEKSDSVVKDQSSTRDDLEFAEDRRHGRKRGSSHDDDYLHDENRESGKRDRSSSSYRKHEKTKSTKEDSVAGASSEFRDDKKSSHHSSSRSSRSSRYLEEHPSRVSRSHRREEKFEEDYNKHQDFDATIKESRSSHRRQEKAMDASKKMGHRLRSRSPGNEIPRDSEGSRGSGKENQPHDVDSIGADLKGGIHDSVDHSKGVHNGSLLPEDNEISTKSKKLEKSTDSLEDYNLTDDKDYSAQDAEADKGSMQPDIAGVVDKGDHGSGHYCRDNKHERKVQVNDLDATGLGSRALEMEETPEDVCNKLADTDCEYRVLNSKDNKHDMILEQEPIENSKRGEKIEKDVNDSKDAMYDRNSRR